jgi:hypothetical protein
MKIGNYPLSIIGFSISVVSAFLLFAGLFSAHWDYIVDHLFDTVFVLFFGTLIPIGYLMGIIFLIKGIISKDYSYIVLTLFVSLVSSIIMFTLGLEIFISSVLKLYKIKIGMD